MNTVTLTRLRIHACVENDMYIMCMYNELYVHLCTCVHHVRLVCLLACARWPAEPILANPEVAAPSGK